MDSKTLLKCAYGFYLLYFSFQLRTACPFNKNCTCDNNEGLIIVCIWDSPKFPTFQQYNSTPIISITIKITNTTGNLSLIPPNAFVALESFDLPTINFQSNSTSTECRSNAPIVISQDAFNTYQNAGIFDLNFQNVFIPKLRANQFANISFLHGLYYVETCIDIISDYAFSGLSVPVLQIGSDCGSPLNRYKMEALSLSDIHTSNYLGFVNSGLTDILPFKQTNAKTLALSLNAFTSIPDFAFCQCNISSQCSNANLVELNLRANKIGPNISTDAFANLPFLAVLDLSENKLSTFTIRLPSLEALYLQINYLTDVPISALRQLQSSLTTLKLGNNNITNIPANCFFNFTRLTYVDFESNPIARIEPGAFNGCTSMPSLNFYFLNELKSVDLLVTYGMSSLIEVGFYGCGLSDVYMGDIKKLPVSLSKISLNEMNTLQKIDSNFGQWLKNSMANILDLSQNQNFSCTSEIGWMANYAICNNQIITIGTVCQDGTTLLDYLLNFASC